MKIRVEFDIKPKELREVLGLPDVSGIQQEALEVVTAKLRSGAEEFDPLAVLRSFVPSGLLSVDEWQKMLVRALEAGGVVEVEEEKKAPGGRRRKKAGSRD